MKYSEAILKALGKLSADKSVICYQTRQNQKSVGTTIDLHKEFGEN